MTKFQKVKFIFFGTPEFAAIILKKLIDNDMAPMAVVTNPDRPAGRKKNLTAPAVVSAIPPLMMGLDSRLRGSTGWRRQGSGNDRDKIDILQPEILDSSFAKQIGGYKADAFVLAAYGKILPQWLIDMPPKGIIGIHPSLLPKYRGATPIQNAILNGDIKSGTTLFLLDKKIDHGPILAKQELKIKNQNYIELNKELAELSAELLIAILPKYLAGKIIPHSQNELTASYTKKFVGADGFVNPRLLLFNEKNKGVVAEGDVAVSIWRKIRALNPEPGVYTIDNGRRMKILEADLKDDKLILKKIQYEGGIPRSY